jgi:3-methyladenine DNA glycosylase/8-oxoguanine DNA glycosylase
MPSTSAPSRTPAAPRAAELGGQSEAELVENGLRGDALPGAALPRTGRMSLGPVPRAFSLRRTAMSHGWCALTPTAYDRISDVLHRTLALPDAGPLTVSVRQTPAGRLEASWGRVHGSCDDRIAIKAALRRMLALDDDLTELYDACRVDPALAWAEGLAAGRLLRSPTVFEDLAKTLATTNCSWALTRSMCRRLVETLGETGPAGERTFPTASAVAAAGAAHLRDEVRAGYRSRAFVELAAEVASGELDVERWLPSSPAAPSDEEVLRSVLELRGFGPYAAQGMLGLLGRPRGLALDSWVRAKLPKLLGVPALTDEEITARYSAYGRWGGTVLWLELTRDWFEPPVG